MWCHLLNDNVLCVVSSTVLTSCCRHLHQCVAELLNWSDGVLLDGDTAAVDTLHAEQIINSIRQSVDVCPRYGHDSIPVASATTTTSVIRDVNEAGHYEVEAKTKAVKTKAETKT